MKAFEEKEDYHGEKNAMVFMILKTLCKIEHLLLSKCSISIHISKQSPTKTPTGTSTIKPIMSDHQIK